MRNAYFMRRIGKVDAKEDSSVFVDLSYDDLPIRRITPAVNGALQNRAMLSVQYDTCGEAVADHNFCS
jgi:hypothetical protein